MRAFMLCILFLLLLSMQSQNRLGGKVTGLAGDVPLPGAVLYFPELKKGAVTNDSGWYSFRDLPSIKTLVQVRYIGHRSLLEVVDLSKQTRLDFHLEESVVEEGEVIVTGTSRATALRQNPAPALQLDRKYLSEQNSVNIVDALSKVPGIAALSSGPNVAKPVIRGLGFNRVLALFDGVRQEGQQWGEEHGVEIDQFLVDRVEVIKGPASVIYGSDALGGVINFLPANPLPEGKWRAGWQNEYHTNNGMVATSIYQQDNRRGFITGCRATYKRATDFKNPVDGRVFNTGFLERDVSLSAGVNRRWGFSHLSLSLYNNLQEIPDGARDSSSRRFVKQIWELDDYRPIVQQKELDSYRINVIHQDILHVRANLNNNFLIGQSRLAVRLGWQNSMRKEFSHPEHPGVPGLFLDLQTLTYDLKFYLPQYRGWESTLGLNGMNQVNRVEAGTEFLVPFYQLTDIGPFVHTTRSFRKITVAAGARYDSRFIATRELFTAPDAEGFERKSDSPLATRRFYEGSHRFHGFSLSAGAAWQMARRLTLKTNFAAGYRAPNIAELSAGGVHPGTGYMQAGNVKLVPETNRQADCDLYFDSEHLSIGLDLFVNSVANYIYNRKLLSASGADSLFTESNQTYPVYAYTQTRALLYGAEAKVDLHPHPFDWLHFENSVSILYGNNRGAPGVSIGNGNKYLPGIPPLHTYSELRAEIKKVGRRIKSSYIKAGLQYYSSQKRIFSEGGTETPTAGYFLLDAGMGTQICNKSGRSVFSLAIGVSNATDAVYQSHLSRLKYMEPFPHSAGSRSGIYGMGRNLTFKLSIPLGLQD